MHLTCPLKQCQRQKSAVDLWPSFPICQPSTHADSLHRSTFSAALQCANKKPPKQKQPTVTRLLPAVNCYPSRSYCEVSPWLAGTMRHCACECVCEKVNPCFQAGVWACVSALGCGLCLSARVEICACGQSCLHDLCFLCFGWNEELQRSGGSRLSVPQGCYTHSCKHTHVVVALVKAIVNLTCDHKDCSHTFTIHSPS